MISRILVAADQHLRPVSSDSFSFSSSVANDYGLFLSDEDPKKGIWLEAGKALDYYMLRNGVGHTSGMWF